MSAGIRFVALTPGLMAAVADSKVTTREVGLMSPISPGRERSVQFQRGTFGGFVKKDFPLV